MDSVIEKAVAAMEAGRIDEGRFLLETLSPEFLDEEDRIEWCFWLARALILGQEPDAEGALELLQGGLKDSPRESRLHLARAIVLCESGRFDEAERSFSTAVRLAPDDWQTHFNRGIFREQLGRDDKALRSFQVAVREAGSESSEPLIRLAWTLSRLGRFDEAIAQLQRYLQREPVDAQEWVTLAVAESESGHTEAALAAIQTALSYEPGNTSALFNAVVVCARAGDLESLDFYVSELARWAPRDRRTDWARGISASLHGDPESGAAILMRIFRSLLRSPELGPGELGALAAWLFPMLEELEAREDARLLLREALCAFLFDEEMLLAYTECFGAPSHQAHRILLLVDASDPDEAHDDAGILRQWRYRRRYEIIASSTDQAWTIALETERLIGGEDIRRGELIEDEPLQGVHRLGLLYLSEGQAYRDDDDEGSGSAWPTTP